MIATVILAAVATVAVSRYVLAATCVFSAVRAAAMARQAGGIYGPHLLLIAGWSLMFAAGMLTLASGLVVPLVGLFFLEALNISAAVTVGGWATLAYRLRHVEKALP